MPGAPGAWGTVRSSSPGGAGGRHARAPGRRRSASSHAPAGRADRRTAASPRSPRCARRRATRRAPWRERTHGSCSIAAAAAPGVDVEQRRVARPARPAATTCAAGLVHGAGHRHRAGGEERRVEEEPGADDDGRRRRARWQRRRRRRRPCSRMTAVRRAEMRGSIRPPAAARRHGGRPAPAPRPAPRRSAAAPCRPRSRLRSRRGAGRSPCRSSVACTAPVFPSSKPRRRTSVRSVTPQRSATTRAHVLHQRVHVVGPPALVRLDEVGVLLRHVGRAEPEALQPGRLDQPPGRVALGVGEDRAGVGAAGLVLPPPSDDGGHRRLLGLAPIPA